jgi:hypothetical protein
MDPRAEALASFEPLPGADGYQGGVRVAVPVGVLDRVSFIERSLTPTAYAVSKAHQRRIWGSPQLLPLKPGFESIALVVREPCERIEFFIRLPSRVSSDLEVKVGTYTERASDGRLDEAPHFHRFSSVHIDKALFAKRIRVSVSDPLVGVAYAVIWALPHDAVLDALSTPDGGQYLKSVAEAERLRKALEAFRDDHSHWVHKLFLDVVARYRHELIAAGGANERDELEVALFVPTSPLWTSESTWEHVTARPVLVPACATFPPGHQYWMQSWNAGEALAGRAFAINQITRYFSPNSVRYQEPPDSWAVGEAPTYIPSGDREHSVLYSLPLRHPRRADVVLGAVSVGTYRTYSDLSLEVRMPESGLEPQQYRTADIILAERINGFMEQFWKLVAGS